MSNLLSDPAAIWALAIVVLLPLIAIGAAELAERLRQRDSVWSPVLATLRTWTIPMFALWALGRGLFDLDSSNLIIRLLGTGLLLSLAVAALSVVRILVTRLAEWRDDGERGSIPQLLLALPRVLVIIATGWFLIDGVWGIDLSAAMTALGVTSLVISFALQDTLSGLASGMLLLSDAPFQPGDWIRSADIEGRVVDINWRSSRITDRNGDLLVVPNAQLAGATVINFDRPTRLHRVVVPVQVAYVNPPTSAKEMLLDAARSTRGVLADPPPNVRVVQVDDPLMGYEIDMWIEDFTIAPRVASDFGSLVWYQSHRHDVPLPSPAQDLYLYDGVEAGLSGTPDRAEIRQRLRSSPLLDQLTDDHLDRLSSGAAAARYAGGEIILDTRTTSRDLFVLWSGTARIVATSADGVSRDVVELNPGDVFGLLGKSEGWLQPPRVIAVDDCEILRVNQAVAQEVTSHNPVLAAVLNQVTNSRRRRLDRILESAENAAALDSDVAEMGTSTEERL